MDKINSFEIIMELVKGCHYKDKTGEYNCYIKSEYNGRDVSIWNCNYLLNQVLRQISIPDENKLVSKAARKLWNEIDPEGNKNINDYYYHEKIIATKSGAKIKIYKGANKNPTEEKVLNKGDSFIFKDVFHLEHVVPISKIIDELIKLDEQEELNYETLNDVINKIYVCRMTKEEDRGIKAKYNRGDTLDYKEVIEKYYKSKDNDFIIEIE